MNRSTEINRSIRLLGCSRPDLTRIVPTGKVRFYREDSGYGLIEADDGGKDVFVDVTSVADPSVETFREDRRVRYVERVRQHSCNPEAFDVVVL